MHAAPAVRVRIGRDWGWPAFIGVCLGVTAGNLAAWWLLHRELASIAPLAVLLAAATGVVTGLRLHRSQAGGELQWDGAQWRWRGSEGQAQVALDLGAWLLLRFEPRTGPRQWVAVARRRTEGPWAALRAALYAPRPADPLDTPPA